jgi:hypothetical protein
MAGGNYSILGTTEAAAPSARAHHAGDNGAAAGPMEGSSAEKGMRQTGSCWNARALVSA